MNQLEALHQKSYSLVVRKVSTKKFTDVRIQKC